MCFLPPHFMEDSKALSNLNLGKSVACGGIPTDFLRPYYDVVLDNPVLLMNKSTEEGVSPEPLNLAKDTLLYKKGRKLDTEIYRSLSVLHVIKKSFNECL